jgi:hypothetical protein
MPETPPAYAATGGAANCTIYTLVDAVGALRATSEPVATRTADAATAIAI